RLDAAQPRLHVVAAVWRGDGIGAAQLDVGRAPAQRPAEIDDAARRQQRTQGALGLLFDLGPARRRDRRLLAEQMVHFFTCRRLPIARLPSDSAAAGSSPPPSTTASISVTGASVNRYVRKCSASLASRRRSHSSTMEACSFSSSRLCSRMARSSESTVA